MKPAAISLGVLALLLAASLFARAHVIALCDDTEAFLETLSEDAAREAAERWDREAAFLDAVMPPEPVVAVRCALRKLEAAARNGARDALADAQAELAVRLDVIRSGQEVDFRNIF